MKINDIITLTQAGWTKDDIMSLMANANAEQPEQPAPQPEQPATQPEPPVPQPVDNGDDRFAQLETKLDYVINRFNYIAVQNSQQPDQPGETIDDILASVVRGVKDK